MVKNASTLRYKINKVDEARTRENVKVENCQKPTEIEGLSSTSVTVVLSVTSKLYDPSGIISPVIILLKIAFQAVCKSSLTWDETIVSALQQQWLRIFKDMRGGKIKQALFL